MKIQLNTLNGNVNESRIPMKNNKKYFIIQYRKKLISELL